MAIRTGHSLRAQSRPPRVISGIDLPEVAPAQAGLEVAESERSARSSHVAPQWVHTRYGSASGIEAVRFDQTKDTPSSIEPDDSASTRGFLPSPNKPHNVVRPPFYRNKRVRRWLVAGAFVVAILLAIVISVAVTQIMSHKTPQTTPSPISYTVTTSGPAATSTTPSTTSGCPSYTGTPLSALPPTITRPGGPAPTPSAANAVATIIFSQAYSYDVADSDAPATSNAFTSIPQGFAYALNGDLASQFIVNAFTPIDTTPQQCYIATQAKFNMPQNMVGQLKQQATADRSDPAVRLWHNPNGNTADLLSKIQEIRF